MPFLSRHLLQRSVTLGCAVWFTTCWLTGCGTAPDSSVDTSGPATPVAAHHDHDHAHDHPEEGPHQGYLVELGNEAYHAEFVHAADGTLTVYILDSSAKNAVPIEATELTINHAHDGKVEQYPLTAKPDSNDPEGTSSRFVSAETHLEQTLTADGSSSRLTVTIEGKQYTGRITPGHGHSHRGHKH